MSPIFRPPPPKCTAALYNSISTTFKSLTPPETATFLRSCFGEVSVDDYDRESDADTNFNKVNIAPGARSGEVRGSLKIPSSLVSLDRRLSYAPDLIRYLAPPHLADFPAFALLFCLNHTQPTTPASSHPKKCPLLLLLEQRSLFYALQKDSTKPCCRT